MISERIGRYQVNEEIGRGGMATVYLAHDPQLFERDVAIKVLPPQFTHDPGFRARFEREAQTIAAIEHPAIVPVYDFGEEEGCPYLVMRYMSGGSLAKRLRAGPLSHAETATILTRLAPALDEIHRYGVIHRDLKPGNILFDRYGNAFLSDFGIAHLAGASTLTGDAILGTPSYICPEQARGDQEITGSCDIYALGAILFEMLSGKQPYEAVTPMGLLMKHLNDPVPRLLDVRPDLSPEFDRLISKAMAKEPGQRFATATEMAARFAEIANRASQQPGIPPGSPLMAEKNPPPDVKPAQSEQPAASKRQPGQTPAGPQPQPGRRAQLPTSPGTRGAQPGQRNRVPIWAFALGILVLLGVCGALVIGTGGLLFISQPGRDKTEPAQLTLDEKITVANQPERTPEGDEPPVSEADRITTFVDDFSNPASGWQLVEEAGSYSGYYHDSYRIYVDRTYMIFWSTPGLDFEDVTVEADATKVGGADDNYFGLVCRYQNEDNFYVFAIMSSGHYAVAKIQNGEFKLIGMDGLYFNDAIHQGTTTNRLRAECVGDTLTFFANGIKLVSVEDDTFRRGDVGLTAAAFDMYGTDILFDNFVAQEP